MVKELSDLETELIRALEAANEAACLAPVGICTQWAQLAAARIEAAKNIVEKMKAKNG